MEGFEYVVNPVVTPKVAFGSGLERQTLPLNSAYMSPFMRMHMGESNRSPGPAVYNNNKNLYSKSFPSLDGFSAFASKCPRLPALSITKGPDPTTYNVLNKPEIFKQSYKPFGIGARRTIPQRFPTPAPTTYPYHLKRPELRVNTAFGSRRKFTPYVTVICAPNHSAICYKCSQTPNGDYWHNNISSEDLCRPCMQILKNKSKSCTIKNSLRLRYLRKIDEFIPVRYCGFLHNHNGTTAAIQTMPNSNVKMKIRKENYLALYMSN